MSEVQAVPEERVSELENVIGFDLETGGLDEQNDQVLELYARAGRIVGGRFETHKSGGWEGVQIVFPIMTNPLEWHPAVVEMHAKNGLLTEAHKLNKEIEKRTGYGTVDYLRAIQDTIKEADRKHEPAHRAAADVAYSIKSFERYQSWARSLNEQR